MISIPHKTKQFLVLLIKVLIVAGAFYFIYNQLANNDKLDWVQFMTKFKKNQSVAGIGFILLLSVLNRYFEILKWQNLASYIKPISVLEATKQVLAALTAGIFTPNGVGEYAGKALYYEKHETKQVVFLNLICNGIQMVLTILIGLVGLFYFNIQFNIVETQTVLLIFGVLILVFVVLFSIKKIAIKGYSIEKLIQKINEIPKRIHRKNILLGSCRYLVFSHQYYFLFLAFDVDLPYLTLMSAVTSVYFLASSLPTFQFLDFAVKGSVAIFFFGILGVNEWIVIFVSTLMWFLNVVLPVVIGSYYVLNFKSPLAPENSATRKHI
ncbi:lysylphosphatidylglycerol synthase domain-containing protein [Flavobacterium muglaense]|uniref:Flippase-like domain-containing protein n=1 Tax=Flavobacterium muglaense TaxID=2764716 RepID=A0A923MXC1_9FLAO|nr:lysylphosphatidylglycerol synthase domain-containing protein [Flavobacterium muglaense]MBC5836957.1 flippase-like domain-containing protein [Flavobacterium muglaense]MBC5843486.1 flippase-like domain-containing protein [Flavobacterium muglaense]